MDAAYDEMRSAYTYTSDVEKPYRMAVIGVSRWFRVEDTSILGLQRAVDYHKALNRKTKRGITISMQEIQTGQTEIESRLPRYMINTGGCISYDISSVCTINVSNLIIDQVLGSVRDAPQRADHRSQFLLLELKDRCLLLDNDSIF